jgi:hypothetical protein
MSDQEAQEKIIESVVGLLKDVSPWFSVAITAAIIIWAITRARSAHFLLDKVWRFIGGGAISDPDLTKAWMDIRDVEGFRFRTGINFQSKKSLCHTLKWLDDNGMSLKDLSFARAWISNRPWEFRQPKLRLIRSSVSLATITLGILSLGMGFMAGEPRVLLSVKSSSATFWTDGTLATNFKLSSSTPEFSVTQTDCKHNKIEGVDEKDAKVICATLDPAAQKELKKMLLEQQALSGYVILLCIIFLVLTARYSARASMATKFYALSAPQAS